MAKLVPMERVAAQLKSGEWRALDPRRPMKYLSGHLPAAINIPLYKAFDQEGSLLAPQLLGRLIGAAGLGNDSRPVLYDSPEGQNAAMLAWILEYLGHREVLIMERFFETWQERGYEVRYKPVELPSSTFSVEPDPSVRMTLEQPGDWQGASFVDFRSRAEYTGAQVIGNDKPGHIPGAVGIDWRELGGGGQLLKPAAELAQVLEARGLKQGAGLIAYCRSGPRAALGYLALRQLGYEVQLFDGSFAQWSHAGLPVEK